MAGTVTPTVFTGTGAYDPVKLVVGPGKMYFNVPIPADGASLSTILTSGVPTGTGFLAGYTKSGTTYHSAMTISGYEVDEVRSPIFYNPTQETVSIQGTLVQVAEKEALLAMLPNYNFKTPDSYHVGGLTSWPATAYPSVLVVAQNRATPGKIVAVMIYKALNTQEFIMAITRQNPSETAFTFSANAIGTSEAGDQLGQVWLEP